MRVYTELFTGSQKLLYAKQGEDRSKMKEIAASIKPAIVKMIKNQNIDSVAFVPPTVVV